MAPKMACIAGEEIYRQWDAGRLDGRRIGPRNTPFGDSGDLFEVRADGVSYYVLARHGLGMDKPAPREMNNRANIYALKDLGVRCVLAWMPSGAITHTFAVGDLVIPDDVIDQTYLRHNTFYENSPLGYLRQFPVFCPALRRAVGEVLHEMKLVYHGAGTAAVCEGPRLETPAEIRMLNAIGAEVVTHVCVPEVFLAKELELCYAAVCYVVNYAETGSRHRPFKTEDLFGGLTQQSDSERLDAATGAMGEIARRVAVAVEQAEPDCDCGKTMAALARYYGLSRDWREWIEKGA